MAPVSQRLTFGCEAVATPNSMRRIRAHAAMSCPACSRAARSRSRSASPQATSATGCPDTTIVSHTHIQGVYAFRSYYAYVTYMACPTVPSLNCHDGSRQTRGATRARERHLRSTPVRYRHPGTTCRPRCCERLAGTTYHGARAADSRPYRSIGNTPGSITSNVYVIQVPSLQNNCSEIFVVVHPQAPCISTGC